MTDAAELVKLADGINGCFSQAMKALRHIALNDIPTGGQSNFNREHLLQIASEIQRTLAAQPRPTRQTDDVREAYDQFVKKVDAAELVKLAAPMLALAQAGIPTDIQGLLVRGDPSRGIAPGALAKALAAQQDGATGDTIPVSRLWLTRVLHSLEGDLPSGRIGDNVFLLRGMLKDILARPEQRRTTDK